uniref:Uncharacterized protein n=1 Tax=Coptotermes formosanus TaxID=36987 RepID=R4UWP9_COPFO|nr:hypothetical protein [Coptotermes formosanus]
MRNRQVTILPVLWWKSAAGSQYDAVCFLTSCSRIRTDCRIGVRKSLFQMFAHRPSLLIWFCSVRPGLPFDNIQSQLPRALFNKS